MGQGKLKPKSGQPAVVQIQIAGDLGDLNGPDENKRGDALSHREIQIKEKNDGSPKGGIDQCPDKEQILSRRSKSVAKTVS